MSLQICVRTVIFTSVTSLTPATFAASAPRATDLAWISGTWHSTEAGAVTDIVYSTAEAGMLLGILRLADQNRVNFFEYERIVEENGSLVLYPAPNGNAGVAFTLTELSASRAVFTNPAHAFPREIIFSLDEQGDLHIVVNGDQGGKAVTQEMLGHRAS